MRQQSLCAVIGIALIGFGWPVGRAQNAQPDFEILVTASGSSASVQCVRGCRLATSGLPKPVGSTVVTLTCNETAGKCGEMRLSGWIER
jgi:hypothetical protein